MRWAGKGPTPGPGLFEFLGRGPWARRGKGLEAGRSSIGARSLDYRVRPRVGGAGNTDRREGAGREEWGGRNRERDYDCQADKTVEDEAGGKY